MTTTIFGMMTTIAKKCNQVIRVEGVSSGRLVRKPPVSKGHLREDLGDCSGRIWNENIPHRKKPHVATNGP